KTDGLLEERGKLKPLGSSIHHEDLLQRRLLDQAGEIVKLMKENQMMDFQNDWKLITVFFSAENPCSSCASTQPVPKAFVNLVDTTEMTTSFLMCHDPQNASNSTENQCNCIHEQSMLNYNILRWSYQDAWEKLLKSKRYDQKDDFTVVLQPSLQETNLLLSLSRDGFFSTSKTQVETLEEDYTFMALSLWKNMLEPVGQKKPYDFTELHQVQCPSQERSYGTNVPCFNQGPSDTVPDSVHKLRPADIRVIAALGDSITAGNGAASNPHDVLDVLTQYRDILREFNPSLIGYSTGTGTQTTENAALNQAVAGAEAEDVPAQVRRLVDRMMNDSRINMQSDWKLITLFIGGNDLCKFCEDPIRHSPENYTYNIQVALDMLHKEERTRELVESGRYDTREDFTVVMQPFLTHISMPKTQVEPVGKKTDDQQMENEIVLKCPSEAEPFLRTYKNSNYTYPNQTPNYGSQLLCEDRSPSSPSPTSVHSLKPADVKIIAALGDSLTAGTGIASYSLMDLATQFRGLSWSIGGDDSLENVTTLPNIFREFNAKIEGYSTGTGSENDPNAFLNQAVPGAQAEHLPAQARALLRLMKTDSRIDFSADWKIITVHIGGNDLCNYCKDPDHYSAVNFTSRIQETLDILHEQASTVKLSWHSSLSCYLCSCVLTGEENSENLTMVREATRAYQLGIQRLVESGRYDTHDNFTVVIQTFFQNPKIPLDQDGHPDISYFAPDCFHPSQKGHSQLAKALWNAMLQPVGQKADSFDFTTDIVLSCPTQNNSFLSTNKNSNNANPPVLPTSEPTENWGSDLSCSETTPSSRVPTSDILKKFSPNLFGFSTGNSKEAAGFNAAERGATSGFLPLLAFPEMRSVRENDDEFLEHTSKILLPSSYSNMPTQARKLVELMRSSSKINFKEDWKLITIFIGGNDLCQYCLDKAEALQLVNSGRYEQREDFAVVVQPFFRNTILPLDSNGKPDLSFFATDCFHFSEKGYAEMAVALWNNMMEPVGEKQTYNNFTYDRSKLKCPNSEKPFLSTLRNSGFRNSALNLEKTEPSVPYWAVIVAAVAGVLVGSLLLWAVSGRRARRHRREVDAEKSMKTTSL
ncbi:hypothetical protein CIB84_000366, partial [Bambusicola thoracicus]